MANAVMASLDPPRAISAIQQRLVTALVWLFGCVIALSGCSRDSRSAQTGASRPRSGQESQSVGARPLYYRHPMNPAITSPVPAKDEMGMDYLAVYAEPAEVGGEVHVSSTFVQKLGIRSEPVVVGPLSTEIRAPGIVRYDQRLISEAYVPTAGRVDNLSVRSVGQALKAGQLLFELYSPALVAADTQYLQIGRLGACRSREPFCQRAARPGAH